MADQEYPPEQLAAAEQAVREAPGRTAAELAERVRLILAGSRLLSRGRMLAVLSELERLGKVTRSTGQARVGFYPAEEDSHDER